MSSTCCKQLRCRPQVMPMSPYCVSTKLSKPQLREKTTRGCGVLSLEFHPCPSATLPPARTHSPWVAAIPRSHGQLLLVTHDQNLLSPQFSAVHAVLGHGRISDVQLRRSPASDEFHFFHHLLSSATSEEHSDHLWRSTLQISTLVQFIFLQRKKKYNKPNQNKRVGVNM